MKFEYPKLQNIGGKYKRVLETYYLGDWVIPEGFVTDLASIPFFLKWWYDDDDDLSAAALVHDFLYDRQPCPRREADDIFHALLLMTGVSEIRATLCWTGVRIGGWWAWRGKSHEEEHAQGHDQEEG